MYSHQADFFIRITGSVDSPQPAAESKMVRPNILFSEVVLPP